MAIKAKIDKQGRLVIPSEYRKRLAITEETPLEISIIANQLLIRRTTSVDKDMIDQWKQNIKSLNLKPQTIDQDSSNSNWMSEEYIRNKLGL